MDLHLRVEDLLVPRQLRDVFAVLRQAAVHVGERAVVLLEPPAERVEVRRVRRRVLHDRLAVDRDARLEVAYERLV